MVDMVDMVEGWGWWVGVVLVVGGGCVGRTQFLLTYILTWVFDGWVVEVVVGAACGKVPSTLDAPPRHERRATRR